MRGTEVISRDCHATLATTTSDRYALRARKDRNDQYIACIKNTQNRLYFVTQGFSLAMSRPKRPALHSLIPGLKQYKAALNKFHCKRISSEMQRKKSVQRSADAPSFFVKNFLPALTSILQSISGQRRGHSQERAPYRKSLSGQISGRALVRVKIVALRSPAPAL